jgi:hypothetical protein
MVHVLSPPSWADRVVDIGIDGLVSNRADDIRHRAMVSRTDLG